MTTLAIFGYVWIFTMAGLLVVLALAALDYLPKRLACRLHGHRWALSQTHAHNASRSYSVKVWRAYCSRCGVDEAAL